MTLVQQFRGAYKGKWDLKIRIQRLKRCGHCGGEVTAEEKFKKLNNGEVNRHVYYRCTKKVDLKCPEKYMNEKVLEDMLEKFIAEYGEN